MKLLIILLTFLCFVFNSCKTIEVQKAKPSDKIISGAVYKLPQTQLLFEVNLKTTTHEKNPLGCFDEYKETFQGIVSKDLIKAIEKKYDTPVINSKITSIVISALPVLDTNKIFTINTSGNFFNNRVYGLSLDDNGIMNKGEFSSENIAVPMFL